MLNVVLINVEKYLIFTFFSDKIEKKSINHESLMFEWYIDKCLEVSKFHDFFRKKRKKVKNHVYLMFKCWIDKCLKVFNIHVFFRKNWKKVEKSLKLDCWMLN